MNDVVVLYHANCPDGFGGAYAAWKKFGDAASYIPVYHGDPPPTLSGKEVYLVDFASYPLEDLLALQEKNKRLVVLDHHEGVAETVKRVREHVYDSERSGAGIAWNYFHPGKPLPRLLAYIEDTDLWRRSLPHSKEIAAFVSTLPFDFESFDLATEKAESEEGFADMLEKGCAYGEYFDYACTKIIEQAEEVEFDGHHIFAANAPRLFRSEVGNRLARMHGPFAIVWYRHHGKWHFSMRGDGSIDLTKVAQKYGGNGHPNAASFQLNLDVPFPFSFIKRK